MEDYREKIEKLPVERLSGLITIYQRTIKGLQDQYNEASQVAMLKIAEYTKTQIDQKQAELDQLQEILKKRQSEQ